LSGDAAGEASRIDVRRARPADAETLAGIAVPSWREGFRGIVPEEIDPRRAWRPERLAERLRDSRSETTILLAERAGRPAGFVVFGPSRDDDAAATVGEVWALYVHPREWRRGVGRALVERALAGLRAADYREVTVWTLAESPRNLGFYEALEFRRDGAEQHRPSFGSPLEVRFRRPL
jgi:GNAT superfamily N-acetyltransferase